MDILNIINTKKNGGSLTKEEIDFFINQYSNGEIPDYQASALLMAIFTKGMSNDEISNLTQSMLNSGDVLDLSDINGFKVDKHSSGGVGDKVSIPLAPLVSSLGIVVPMISGRGLGHTGGTLDKLESIPGFQVEISEEEFKNNLKNVGTNIISATGNIAPADKNIYSLRDVTGTVDSIPLISASIMSKKLASGTNGLVLDVKTGDGAFMKDEKDAETLAETLVNIGKNAGMKISAIISSMDQPLGTSVGNSVEIIESIEFLKGNYSKDLYDIVIGIGSKMVVMSGKAENEEEAKKLLDENIKNGKGLQKFREMIISQGGNGDVVDDYSKFPQSTNKIVIKSDKSGYVSAVKTREIGEIVMDLGGGRKKKEDKLDYSVGIILNKKIGDFIEKGDGIATLYTNEDTNSSNIIIDRIKNAFILTSEKVPETNLIKKTIN